jgi:hypothetical protein
VSPEPAGKASPEERVTRQNQFIPWAAVIGVLLSGGAGLIGGIQALSHAGAQRADHFVGAGVCLMAAALGFGLLSNAIFRH